MGCHLFLFFLNPPSFKVLFALCNNYVATFRLTCFCRNIRFAAPVPHQRDLWCLHTRKPDSYSNAGYGYIVCALWIRKPSMPWTAGLNPQRRNLRPPGLQGELHLLTCTSKPNRQTFQSFNSIAEAHRRGHFTVKSLLYEQNLSQVEFHLPDCRGSCIAVIKLDILASEVQATMFFKQHLSSPQGCWQTAINTWSISAERLKTPISLGELSSTQKGRIFRHTHFHPAATELLNT